MKRILRMTFWGGVTLSLIAGLAGILFLWVSSMASATPQGDMFPLLLAASMLGLFIPKAKNRFAKARG